MKPHIVIFSSSAALTIAEGLQEQITLDYVCHLWKGDFFGENKTTPLWTFFKKLFHYDYVILVLSDDNMTKSTDHKDKGQLVPKDNVIFELGACMARLGPQKTIMVTPDTPHIHLPSYFDDVEPLRFSYTNIKLPTAQQAVSATAAAAGSILSLLGALTADSFHVELPAQGLAYAYQFNFLQPLLNASNWEVFQMATSDFDWNPEDGIRISIVIPDQIMDRNAVKEYFSQNYPEQISKGNFITSDGRNLGVYMINFKSPHQPLQIIDIPTTLLTTRNVIGKIEQFWRDKDSTHVKNTDDDFIQALESREILNFERAIGQFQRKFGDRVSVISLEQLDQLIQGDAKPPN